MVELGQLLKERRVVLGMDLDDVERRTKIRKKYLEALEEGDWSVLPGEVYARGFIRSYAECVGLDGLELLERYIDQPHVESLANQGKRPSLDKPLSEPRTERSSGEPQSVSARPTQSVSKPSASGQTNRSSQDEGLPYVPPSVRRGPNAVKSRARERRGSPIGSVVGQGAAVLVAFALLAGAWWVVRSHHTTTPQVAAGNTSQNSTNSVASNALGGSTGSGAASNQAANNAGSQANTNTANSAGTQTPPVSTISVQPYNANTGILTVLDTGAGPLVLNATAQGGQCWTQVLADGKSVDPNDFIVPGKTKSWSAAQELRIDLGNVPVVSMTVNGQAVSLPNVKRPIWVVIKKQS